MLGLPRGSEWIFILIIIVILFGVGRIGKIGKELGSGIRGFKEGLKGEDTDEKAEKKETTEENKTVEPK